MLGAGVALAVISSSGKVSPSFEDHLMTTAVGEFFYFSAADNISVHFRG